MSSSHIVFAVVIAVLVFWIVGAYNRLVSLRGEVAKCFAPVEAQLRQRDALLQRWLDTLRPLLDHALHALQAIEVVAAACGQLRAALDVLCRKPLLAASAATVRLAEATLADARHRLQQALPVAPGDAPQVDVEVAVAAEALSGADTALDFARARFNEASDAYNAARRQFPTWVVAAVFGFRPAGTL